MKRGGGAFRKTEKVPILDDSLTLTGPRIDLDYIPNPSIYLFIQKFAYFALHRPNAENEPSFAAGEIEIAAKQRSLPRVP